MSLDQDREAAPATYAVRERQMRPSLRVRLYAVAILLGGAGLLGLAGWLEPDPRGFGTHQQLGSGPCGMLIVTGLPCPTCGMTTAFAHAVRGQFLRAFWVQPAGFVLALATIGTAVTALWSLITGRVPPVRLGLVTPYRLFIGLLVLLLGGWAFKLAVGLLDGSLPVKVVEL